MLAYVLRRMGVMVVVLAAVSVCAFVIIQLPPGDYLDDYIVGLQARGTEVDQAEVEALRHQYGLDRPIYLQYLRWIGKIVRGDLGSRTTTASRSGRGSPAAAPGPPRRRGSAARSSAAATGSSLRR